MSANLPRWKLGLEHETWQVTSLQASPTLLIQEPLAQELFVPVVSIAQSTEIAEMNWCLLCWVSWNDQVLPTVTRRCAVPLHDPGARWSRGTPAFVGTCRGLEVLPEASTLPQFWSAQPWRISPRAQNPFKKSLPTCTPLTYLGDIIGLWIENNAGIQHTSLLRCGWHSTSLPAPGDRVPSSLLFAWFHGDWSRAGPAKRWTLVCYFWHQFAGSGGAFDRWRFFAGWKGTCDSPVLSDQGTGWRTTPSLMGPGAAGTAEEGFPHWGLRLSFKCYL